MKRAIIASVILLTTIQFSASAQSPQADWRELKPGTITLYSRSKYKHQFEGYGKSTFSFWHGVRSDMKFALTRNNYELQYGNINWNGNSDWFTVTMVTDDCSRIKDLGPLRWSDVIEVPPLPASLLPGGQIRFPSKFETFEESSRGRVARVSEGHVYVVHSKDSVYDFYTMFRVEKLIPGDQVTISWKMVPSPEKLLR